MKNKTKIEYRVLDIIPINQFKTSDNKKGVYSCLWKFSDFCNSIKFTFREPLSYNIFDQEFNLFSQDRKHHPEFNSDYYQRLLNDEKTKKVINFLISELKTSINNPDSYLVTFPTTLILSLFVSDITDFNDYKAYIESISNPFDNNETNESVGVFYAENSKLFLPNLNIMLVVDGQHRLAGFLAIYYSLKTNVENTNGVNPKMIEYASNKLQKENLGNPTDLIKKIENFYFNCSLLLDYDIWEQGKVFADVNFNQKPVNKSLYYDIFGSYPDTENNDLFLAHTWVLKLNTNPNSDAPFRDKINLLGTGNGYISQAFLVEAIFPLLRNRGVWNGFLEDFIKSKTIPKKPILFLETYFEAIKLVLNEFWPNENAKKSDYKHILFKTTGLGALFQLINDIYPVVEKHIDYDNNEILKKEIEKLFYIDPIENKVLKIDAKSLFSKDGNFSKGAGKGLQSRLYNELAIQLGFKQRKISS